MILEVADIRITPGRQAAFEEAIERGLTTVAAQAKGFRGWKVDHSLESPERYLLMIFWDTLEDHTVGFREGPLFPQWRAIVGPFFAQPPQVEHFTLIGKSDARSERTAFASVRVSSVAPRCQGGTRNT